MTAHAGHDHRTTRPEFLHVGCTADPNRVRAGIIVRIDVVRLVVGIDAKPRRGPANPAHRRRDLILGLRDPDLGRCWLRSHNLTGHENAQESQKNCHSPRPNHHLHPITRKPGGLCCNIHTIRQLEHDPEKHALGSDPMGVQRFSEKHALGLDPREHAQTKS
jgi:hypothetical protein